MLKFKDINVGTKIIAGYVLVAAIAAIIGVVGFVGMNRIMEDQKFIGNEAMQEVKNIGIIDEAVSSLMVSERGLINRRMMEPEFRKAQYAFAESAIERIAEASQKYTAIPKSAEEEENWNIFQNYWNDWMKIHPEIIRLSREKDNILATGVSEDDEVITKLDGDIFALSLQTRSIYLAAQEYLDSIGICILAFGLSR